MNVQTPSPRKKYHQSKKNSSQKVNSPYLLGNLSNLCNLASSSSAKRATSISPGNSPEKKKKKKTTEAEGPVRFSTRQAAAGQAKKNQSAGKQLVDKRARETIRKPQTKKKVSNFITCLIHQVDSRQSQEVYIVKASHFSKGKSLSLISYLTIYLNNHCRRW